MGQGGNLAQKKLTALNNEIANSIGSCKSGSKSENFNSRELMGTKLISQVSQVQVFMLWGNQKLGRMALGCEKLKMRTFVPP